MISSPHNAKIQLTRTLMGRPKDRQKENAFVVEGVRLIEEAAAAGWPFRYCLYTEELSPRGQALIQRLQAKEVLCEQVSTHLLKTISETKHSQGILAVVGRSPLPIPEKLSFALILDSIRDPGNLGTLLRAAAAAGAEAAFLSPETADVFAPKVVRAGMGAHFHLPIQELGWEEISRRTASVKIYLAEMDGPIPCWQADFKSPLALLIGGEAEGVSPPARQMAVQAVSIPMPGRAESLNAAMAGVILLFEVVRQRKYASPD